MKALGEAAATRSAGTPEPSAPEWMHRGRRAVELAVRGSLTPKQKASEGINRGRRAVEPMTREPMTHESAAWVRLTLDERGIRA